jgi:hypothetical protein
MFSALLDWMFFLMARNYQEIPENHQKILFGSRQKTTNKNNSTGKMVEVPRNLGEMVTEDLPRNVACATAISG